MQFLIAPFLSLFLAQMIKFIYESIKEHKLMWQRLLNGSGGMPSSHTSFAFALITTVFLECGYNSIEFAISLVFGIIIAYDAMSLRQESGRHATLINKIVEEFSSTKKSSYHRLKEKLGHNPLEVLMGIIFGIIVSCLYYYL